MAETNLETLRMWLQRYKDSEDYSEPFFDKARENYRLYKSYKTSSEKSYKHDIFVPYAFAYLEDLTAYFMLSVFASPQTYSLSPRFSTVTEELCMALEGVVHWALTEENVEFALELEELIKSIGIMNIGYLICYPLVKERQREGNVSNFLERLHMDCPSPLDIYLEPKVKRLSRMRWVIKKSREDWDILKKLEKDGEYQSVDDAKGGFAEDDPVTQLLSEIGMAAGDFGYNDKDGKIEILDCFTGGDVITIAGRRTIIRDTTKDKVRPFLFDFPILDCRMSGAPGEASGIGVIESIKPTNRELNILRSQRRDNISLILNKLFVYDMLSGEVDLSTLFSAPGNVIVTTGREALDELPISDVTGSSFKEEQSLIYDLQNISSMWDYARGGTPRRRETASGIIRLQQAAQSRNEWLLRKLDEYILQPLCRRILVYIREYMPREDFEAIIGETPFQTPAAELSAQFYDMDTNQVRHQFNIMPMTESIVSIKEMNIQQFLQAFDRLIQLPDVNKSALVKQLLLKLGQRDIKDILPALSPNAQQATMGAMPTRGAPPGMVGPPMGPPSGPEGPPQGGVQ